MPEAFVVSYGSSPYEKRDGRSLLWHLWTAARAALDRAGIVKDELDGLALASFGFGPGNVATLGEHFGLRLRWCEQGAYGGSSGVVALGKAADAVRLGRARAVLCLAGDTFTPASHDAMLDSFTPAMRDWLAPHGFGGANGLFALVQRQHMHRHGSTREQMGRLAVAQRERALGNPNALFKAPLTLDEYLNARPIAEPLHLYDCVMPCFGAEAVLVVDGELARACGRPPLQVRAWRELTNAHPPAASSLPGGWELFADELFAEAGVRREDVDVLELYDDYPIMVAIQLERWGFCPEGGGGRHFEQTDLSRINTGGGQLSCGQSGAGGGTIGVVEAVCQLQGEGGARQVAGAEVALVSGFGLVSYGKGLCTSGAVLACR